jgi:hypothetical protein
MTSAGRSFAGASPPPILAFASRRRDLGTLPRVAARFGRELAVELVEAGPTDELDGDLDAQARHHPAAPVLGLRAPLAELEGDPENAPTRGMAQIRALHARRLVYAAGASDLHDLGRARALGRLLDGTAARFQGQSFQLGLDPALDPAFDPADIAARCDGLVALCTQITMPAFFLALGGETVARLLELPWGRALSPLVRQTYIPLPAGNGTPSAEGIALGSSLRMLSEPNRPSNLEAIVFVVANAPHSSCSSPVETALAPGLETALEGAFEKLAEWGLAGLSRAVPVP